MRVHKIGCIGTGFVGTAVSVGFENVLGSGVEIREYDKFKPSESLEAVVNNSDILFFCLPTPMNEDGSCNTEIIESVAEEVDRAAKEPKACIVKSTVPPGTTQFLAEIYNRHCWVFNPEFLTERNFINDFINQDRIILGIAEEYDNNLYKKVYALYEEFKNFTKKANIFETDCNTAEMLKYATNAYLSTKVAFFNELYDICKVSSVNFNDVKELMLLDDRIGKTHVNVPGFDGFRGFGGKCLPKDLNGLIALAEENGEDPMILESVWAKNLMIREKYDWEDIPGAVTENTDFKKVVE